MLKSTNDINIKSDGRRSYRQTQSQSGCANNKWYTGGYTDRQIDR